MSAARCSLCHCFSRNCPQGQPNHRASRDVGQACSMNSQGRHYRDPSTPDQPSCNYVLQGGDICNFFETSEFAEMPYPEDITLGPVTDPPNSQNSDLSSILALLNQQKAETD